MLNRFLPENCFVMGNTSVLELLPAVFQHAIDIVYFEN